MRLVPASQAQPPLIVHPHSVPVGAVLAFCGGTQCANLRPEEDASGLLLFSGVTGTRVDGLVSTDPAEVFEQAFLRLRQGLEAAGASLTDVAEMTTYHVIYASTWTHS